jgi:hypothetical protein
MKYLLLIFISLFVIIDKGFSQIKVSTKDASCPSCKDGSATVNVNGGTPPFEYEWRGPVSGKSSSPYISNLPVGEYIVWIRDKNGCEGSELFEIEYKEEDDEDPDHPHGPHPGPFEIPIIVAGDPNEITGPAGYGEPKWVSINDELTYLIRFENDPAIATAPANKVVISYPIDKMADMFSFKLGDFSFRDFSFQPPPNTSYFYKRMDLVDSMGIYLDVTAGLDVTKNRAFWIFQAYDPFTGLPNINPDLGFLLINDTITHDGEGSVNFSIKPKNTAITGDTIRAYASIVFDINAPILTNSTFNTIDAKPPVSKIKSITAAGSDIIEVHWTGEDDPEGSGIADYKLLISPNSEAYRSYSEITDTSYIVKLRSGNEYRIQTIAKDNTNNTEKLKPIPDTIFYLIPKVRLGKDMSICLNDSVILDAGSAFNTFLWNDGSDKQTLTVKEAGVYYVIASNDTLTSSDTIVIGINPLPVPSLHNNTSVVCEGESLTLDAGDGFKYYEWNTGDNLQQTVVDSPGKYFVNVIDRNGCQGLDSLSVTMLNKPYLSLGNDTTIEDNDTLVLMPYPGNFTSYIWNDSSLTNSLQVIGKKAGIGTHEFWVKVTDNNNCPNSDTINVTVTASVNIEFDNSEHTAIKLFPNPTFGLLNLQIEGIEEGDLLLEIINMEGSKIFMRQYKNSQTIVTDELNISQMPAGTYIIRVTYKQTQMLRTIIKI